MFVAPTAPVHNSTGTVDIKQIINCELVYSSQPDANQGCKTTQIGLARIKLYCFLMDESVCKH